MSNSKSLVERIADAFRHSDNYKKTYKRLCRIYHPDAGGSSEAFVLLEKIYHQFQAHKDKEDLSKEHNSYTKKKFERTTHTVTTDKSTIEITHRCSLKDLLSNKVFHVNQYDLRYPGLVADRIKYGEISVRFKLNDYRIGPYTFSFLDGTPCTIYEYPLRYEEEALMVSGFYVDFEARPDFVDRLGKVLIFKRGGIQYLNPLNNKAYESYLLIPYE